VTQADFDFTYLAPPPPEITYVSKTRISAFGGETLVVNLKNMVQVLVTKGGEGSFSSDVTALFGFVKGITLTLHPHTPHPSPTLHPSHPSPSHPFTLTPFHPPPSTLTLGRVSVVSWNAAATALNLEVPVLPNGGDVELRIFANEQGAENAAAGHASNSLTTVWSLCFFFYPTVALVSTIGHLCFFFLSNSHARGVERRPRVEPPLSGQRRRQWICGDGGAR
jgi:hypothetical protein